MIVAEDIDLLPLAYVASTEIPGVGSYVVGTHQKHLIEAFLMTSTKTLNMSSSPGDVTVMRLLD